MNLVDLTNFFSLTALMHLARHLSIFNIVHSIVRDKKNSFVTFICVVGFGMLWSAVSVTFLSSMNETILTLISIVVCTIPVLLVCKGSIFERILAVILAFVSNMLSTVIAVPLLTAFGVPYSALIATKTSESFVFIISSITFSISFLFSFIIRFVKTKFLSNSTTKSNKSYFFLLIPLLNIMFFLFYAEISRMFDESYLDTPEYLKVKKIVSFFSFICIVSSVALLFFIDYLEKVEQKNIQNEKQILANTMTYEQTLMLNEEKKEFRKIKHDTNNLLTTAIGFMELGKNERALEILKETQNSVASLGGVVLCSNDTINTIAALKTKKANENSVELKLIVNENAPIKIDNFDLCRLLHNLIDNSINAATKCEDKKYSEVEISIDDDFITVNVHNTFNAGSQKSESKTGHGYGTKIIEEIAKKYSGNYSKEAVDEKYHTETKIKNLNTKDV